MEPCGLIDIACHASTAAQSALWSAWDGLGLTKQVMLVAGVLLLVGGAALGLLQFVKRIGGWPGVVGVLLIIAVGVLSVIPHRPKPKPDPAEAVPEWIDPPVKKRRVRTIFDSPIFKRSRNTRN